MIVLPFVAMALLGLPLAPPDDPDPAGRGAPSIRFRAGGPADEPAVEVLGLDVGDLADLSKAEWDASRWAGLLSISVGKDRIDPVSIPGKYRVVGRVLRFEPKYPFEPGLRHRARFDPSRLPRPRRDPAAVAEFTRPAPPKSPPAHVVRVDPSGSILPENLLKFYLTFSAPMSRGEVYDHVRLRDASGRELDSPFLEIGEELWDATGARLTLLLDPGRIKRGLRPREEDGPILESGRTYSIEIDQSWRDAAGQPLREAYKRTFRAGPADEIQPDPKTWKIASPAAASRDPLVVTFPEPLDRAMLDRALTVHDPAGRMVLGRIEIGEGATRWSFRPEQPWTAGRLGLEIDAELEDLAGNSVARPFEVDVLRKIEDKPEVRRVTLPITILKADPPQR